MNQNAVPSSSDEDEIGPGEQWIQDLIDGENAQPSWQQPPDGLPHLLQFTSAVRGGREVPQEVISWLYAALSTFYAEHGKPDLTALLGLRGTPDRLANFDRSWRDEQLLFHMDLLVFIGAKPEEAASILLENRDSADSPLSFDTLMRKFNTKRNRTSPQELAAILHATHGDAHRYLANFNDTYMSAKLLSMKRGR